MNKKLKVMLGLTLIVGFILITGITTSLVSMEEPYETDPHDPGNSRGPGFDYSAPSLFPRIVSIIDETFRMPSNIQ
ncbi:MAG TPA: hypothetical protein VMX55_05670 [candidate division Zixibacteria bacterium]|nr:hypothetical protein [candidate division Zixibacteria bacterium]